MSSIVSPRPLRRQLGRIQRLSLAALTAGLVLAVVGVAPALAQTPWWQVSSETIPTNLPPGGEGEVIVMVSNLGDAPIDGSTEPVSFTDKLPPGLTATAMSGPIRNETQVECVVASLRCSFKGVLNPYEQIAISIDVKVEVPPGAAESLIDEASVEGGGAAKISRSLSLPVSDEAARFGVAGYEMGSFNEDGTAATQAGSHPFQLTTTFALNQTKERYPVELPKDLQFSLPAGLVGNPTAVEQCTMADFFALVEETNLCPASSVVGVATVVAHEPIAKVILRTVPVFNLVPSQGEPARLGFEVIGKVPVVIDTSVRTGRDYGVDVSVKDATETAGLLSSQVTLWGEPGDPRHNSARGWECVAGGAFAGQAKKTCPASSEEPDLPYLTLPTSCATNPVSEPVTSSAEADSWSEPGRFLGTEYTWLNGAGQPVGFEGCAQLPFTPTIKVAPEEHSTSTPTGLSVDVEVPQKTTLEANGLAEADVRNTTVTLPEGMQLSPSAANGLQACSEEQIGYVGLNAATQTQEFTGSQASCPAASKVGLVHIKTPLLTHELEGSVYLASPAPQREGGRNPFGSLVALYIVAEDPVSGVLVKLAGKGELNESTLRVATTFTNAPQVPFEDLRLELFGRARGSVATPARCGRYATQAAFTPWSGTAPVDVSSPGEEFEIASGVNGGSCPQGALPFGPGFVAQAASATAGAFTAFQLELSRPDGDQALSSVSMHLPPGVAALLASVKLCEEPQAARDECPAESQVGEATAVAGLGPEPYVQKGGKVYVTGPYGGAPFGLEIVSPAVAGPFNLGSVTVRSRLFVEPENGSVRIASDPLPTQLRGIPLQLKRVLVEVNRPGFEFNPTSCSPMKIEGSVDGAEGASVAVSSPLAVTGCQSLPFAPKLSATAAGQGSKADGTSLDVKVESGGVNSTGVAQAGIAKVDLQLPIALSSRLSTLQKACTEAVFNANSASCDEDSVIGYATIHTPVLSNPLSGPAYLVSHGGAAFPDVEFVLQGEGITLLLDGKTDIKAGITYSRFESTPDAPFTVFETVLPAGPHGVLTANVPEREDYSLCKTSLHMPTQITAQNGDVINQNTNIAVSGCQGVLSSKSKLTKTQQLAKALKACRSHKNRHRRLTCERQARRRYGAKKTTHKSATGLHRPSGRHAH